MNYFLPDVKRISAFALLCLLLLGAAWLLFGAALLVPRQSTDRLLIALPQQPSAGAFFVAQERSLFDKQGLSLQVESHRMGKTALQSVLDGKADLALVADVPFMLAAMRGEPIATVGAVYESRRGMAVLARADRGIARPEQLAGKSVGTIAGTNGEFFLDTMLLAHNVPRAQVKVVALNIGELGDALRSGKVDAITIWTPELSSLQRELGARAITLYGGDLFMLRFLIAGRSDFIAAHPEALRKLMAALGESNALIRTQPRQALAGIGRAVGTDPALLADSFNAGDYVLSLDQALLLTLGEETRWAMGRGIIAPGAVPNYLDHVRQSPLEAAQPNAVRIIR